MEPFHLNIQTEIGIGDFLIRPIKHGKKTVYQVWSDDEHMFTLESNNKNDCGLILTSEFTDIKIDPELVQKVTAGIQKHYEL